MIQAKSALRINVACLIWLRKPGFKSQYWRDKALFLNSLRPRTKAGNWGDDGGKPRQLNLCDSLWEFWVPLNP
jgi:hypothetical protein